MEAEKGETGNGTRRHNKTGTRTPRDEDMTLTLRKVCFPGNWTLLSKTLAYFTGSQSPNPLSKITDSLHLSLFPARSLRTSVSQLLLL